MKRVEVKTFPRTVQEERWMEIYKSCMNRQLEVLSSFVFLISKLRERRTLTCRHGVQVRKECYWQTMSIPTWASTSSTPARTVGRRSVKGHRPKEEKCSPRSYLLVQSSYVGPTFGATSISVGPITHSSPLDLVSEPISQWSNFFPPWVDFQRNLMV